MQPRIALILVPLLHSCGSSHGGGSTSLDARTFIVEVGSAGTLHLKKDDGDEDTSDVKEQDIQQCRDVFTGTVQGWKIAGSENKISMEPTQAFAAKITGDQNALTLVIQAKAGETAPVNFPGVCLVLAGNQPQVTATLNGVTLEHFKVVGQGHDGQVNITLQAGAKLPAGATDDPGKHVTVNVKDETVPAQ